jgi:hypothetical protein
VSANDERPFCGAVNDRFTVAVETGRTWPLVGHPVNVPAVRLRFSSNDFQTTEAIFGRRTARQMAKAILAAVGEADEPERPEPGVGAAALVTAKRGGTFKLTKVDSLGGGPRRCAGAFCGMTFSALVFPEHLRDASQELMNSRIAELTIRRKKGGEALFRWDRGKMDAPAGTPEVASVVTDLCCGLADIVHGS